MNVGLEGNTSGDLNIPRRRNNPVPLAKVRTRYIGIECAPARAARKQEGPYVVEVVLIEDVERISAQLEFKALGEVNRFLEADVEVAIARLPEILNAWSRARVEVKAAGRFKRVHIQHRLAWIEMGWRLQEWGLTRQQCGRAEVVKLGWHIAERRGNLKRNSGLNAEYSV